MQEKKTIKTVHTIFLPIPPEPKDLKEAAKREREKEKETWDVDSLRLWFGNRLPQYLWKHWKETLKKEGYAWRHLLKILSFHKKDIILWARDEINWQELIERIKDSFEGTIGKGVRGA